MTYQITAKRCGDLVAVVTAEAPDALSACYKAEIMLKAKSTPLQLSTNGTTRLVHWSGLDLEARQV